MINNLFNERKLVCCCHETEVCVASVSMLELPQDGRCKAVITCFVDPLLQDGHIYVLQVSIARNPTVQRRQNDAERSAAPETSGGERDTRTRKTLF